MTALQPLQSPSGTTISTAELRGRLTTRTSRSSTFARWPPSTAGGSASSPAAVTSLAPSRSRPRGWPASTKPRSSDSCAERGIVAGRSVVLYGYDAADVAALGDPARSPRPRRCPHLRGRLDCLGRRRELAGRSPSQLRQARPHGMAPRSCSTGGRPEALRRRAPPPVPRQLRRARGVRGEPPAGCALPRHELARGSGEHLAAPIAGRAR